MTDLQSQVADMLQSNYVDLFETDIEEPYDGTCSWLLRHESYDRWWNGSGTSFLWLRGPPGCGKTTLASFVLRHWTTNFSSSHASGHFFFTRQYEKATSPLNFLSAILHQLMQLYPRASRLIGEILSLHNLQSVASLTSSYEELSSLLIRILDGLSSISSSLPQRPFICVVDAIDECLDTPSTQFLLRLDGILRASRFPIKMLLTCRRNFIDQLHGRVAISTTIDIENENGLDIAKYVRGELGIWCPSPEKSDIISKLEHEIVGRAEGVFLWVVLVVEGLLTRTSRLQTVLDTIYTFPKGRHEKLRRVYEEILRRATGDLKDQKLIIDMKSILGTVITSERPLTLDELAGCLATEGSDFEYLGLEKDITVICRGLLKIEGDRVRPFHITLENYLEDGNECLEDFYIDPNKAHAQLAENCLKYAANRLILVRDSEEDGIRRLIFDHKFLAYAAHFWIYHANGSGPFWTSLVPLIRNLFKELNSFLKWCVIICQPGERSLLGMRLIMFLAICGDSLDMSLLKLTPAHILSFAGLSDSIERCGGSYRTLYIHTQPRTLAVTP